MDRLNGNGLKSTYGIKIIDGYDDFLRYPKVKKGLENNWPEEHGTEVDRSDPKFEDKQVTLECYMEGSGYADFYTKYNAFFDELKKPSLQALYLDAFQATFQVAYEDCTSFKALTPLRNGMVGAKFQVILIIPTSIIEVETIIDGNA